MNAITIWINGFITTVAMAVLLATAINIALRFFIQKFITNTQDKTEMTEEALLSMLTGQQEVKDEVKRRLDMIDPLLSHCEKGECEECARIVCPDKCALHFHHDGCPVCGNTTQE